MTTATLRIPAQTDQVRVARMVACTAARRAGVNEDDVEDVRLAVGEAVGRAVLRHQAAGCEDPVTVELTEDAGGFEAVIIARAEQGEQDEDFAYAVITGLVSGAQLAAEPGGGQRLVLRWAV
ncbi:MAG: ATP-binding protein [Candidatus Nanopelagicales bacterium]